MLYVHDMGKHPWHGMCVVFRGQLCGVSPLLPFMWVVEVVLRSQGLCSKRLYLLNHVTGPQDFSKAKYMACNPSYGETETGRSRQRPVSLACLVCSSERHCIISVGRHGEMA